MFAASRYQLVETVTLANGETVTNRVSYRHVESAYEAICKKTRARVLDASVAHAEYDVIRKDTGETIYHSTAC